ncbi:SUMF1/EgtB/PvdO family nonheme iron enzyme [Pontibacter sp. Tf4]|uniref:formylglycine-generating enzyme family protein n=1 Tax=Pontibacter sp. Tf4 TaxID=2761620 RepID=UPI00162525DF|nr:SUMF1/EgtB/PvdO family nonheme iron enzyme [Pontibacter sp. Tf4]MBB6609486.1 SUMF1/EgtB/PvdO family nonheme iron enzyme [Pontibacter sp. Tf4]
MRNYSFLLLILVCLLSACSYRTPNSAFIGASSTKTGLYNDWPVYYNSKGFQESKLIKWGSVKWVDTLNLTKEEKEAERKAQSATMNKVIVDNNPDDISVKYTPGGIFITPLQLYFDETEVANIHWQEFLHYIKRDSSAAFYQSMLPDSTVIKLNERDYHRYEELGYGRRGGAGRNYSVIGGDTILREMSEQMPVDSIYFRHPEYLYYPIVGVSYEQAVAYCQWRSKVVTEFINSFPKREQKVKVTYRLPTEQEWEIIASAGVDKDKFPWSTATGAVKYKVNPKAAAFIAKKIVEPKPVAQIKQDLKETEVHDLFINVKRPLPYFLQFRTPAYVYGGWPNDYGAYHVQGNVAEMVAEKGIAKGGSWKDELSNSKITDRQLYTTPSDKVGFRCVCQAELIK